VKGRAAYPTLCKGRFKTKLSTGYVFEDPVSLDAATLLPGLRDAGVTALKIEGRQRSRAYIENVVRSFRDALSALEQGRPISSGSLQPMSEGQSNTVGAYRKTWR
jgi:O2-independent ubiquinone biosynthesis protein UbiU